MTASGNVSDPAVIRRVLTTPATWAVVGLSTDATRTAYGVARWMHDALGHRIIPVHPRAPEVWGEPGYRSPPQIPDGTVVAVVDCFVTTHRVGDVFDDAIATRNRLGTASALFQLGVTDEAAAKRDSDACLESVKDS